MVQVHVQKPSATAFRSNSHGKRAAHILINSAVRRARFYFKWCAPEWIPRHVWRTRGVCVIFAIAFGESEPNALQLEMRDNEIEFPHYNVTVAVSLQHCLKRKTQMASIFPEIMNKSTKHRIKSKGQNVSQFSFSAGPLAENIYRAGRNAFM